MHLAPRTEIYSSRSGFVLRTADDEHFALSVSDDDVRRLTRTLAGGPDPDSAGSIAVLTALLDAGHVVREGVTRTYSVVGQGRIASALAGLFERTGMTDSDGTEVIAVSDDEPLASGAFAAQNLSSALSCYRDGSRSLLVPPDVRLSDVAGRRAASNTHRRRIEDGYERCSDGLSVVSPEHPVSDRAAEFVAAQIMAHLDGPAQESLCITAIDLRTYRVSRHRVLPVPDPPR